MQIILKVWIITCKRPLKSLIDSALGTNEIRIHISTSKFERSFGIKKFFSPAPLEKTTNKQTFHLCPQTSSKKLFFKPSEKRKRDRERKKRRRQSFFGRFSLGEKKIPGVNSPSLLEEENWRNFFLGSGTKVSLSLSQCGKAEEVDTNFYKKVSSFSGESRILY